MNDKSNWVVVTVEFGEIDAVHAKVVDPAAVEGDGASMPIITESEAKKNAPPERCGRRPVVLLFTVNVPSFSGMWGLRGKVKTSSQKVLM